MNNELVKLNQISISFDKICVLKDVNLTIKQGDFVGIIGPNGGGKTTLLKVILGLLKPTTGKRLVAGNCILGYVPQYSQFERDFPIRVWDVVLMGRLGRRMIFKRYDNTDRKMAEDALEAVDMVPFKNYQVSKLSGGQRQRVMIARALAAQPKMLLLDEPTANVDCQHGYDLYELLKKLNDERVTIVMVSHDMSAISTYVKQIACVNKTLFYHDSKEITTEMLEATYGCSFELLGHGIPHRVLKKHKENEWDVRNSTL